MTQHYVPTATAVLAPSVADAGAAPVVGAAGVDSLSAQQRGGPVVAAASTEGAPIAEAGQVYGEGSDTRNSTSYGSRNGGSSSGGSISEGDSDEDALLLTTPSRLQRIQQALRGSSSSKTTPFVPGGNSTGSSTTSILEDNSLAGLQCASSAGSSGRTGSSRSDTGISTASSTLTSSSEDEGGGRRTPGKRRKGRQQQQPQQERQPEVQKQVAPAGSMRVLVLAHRHELLHQAEEKFRLMWGSEDLTVSWVKGKRKEFEGQVSKPRGSGCHVQQLQAGWQIPSEGVEVCFLSSMAWLSPKCAWWLLCCLVDCVPCCSCAATCRWWLRQQQLLSTAYPHYASVTSAWWVLLAMNTLTWSAVGPGKHLPCCPCACLPCIMQILDCLSKIHVQSTLVRAQLGQRMVKPLQHGCGFSWLSCRTHACRLLLMRHIIQWPTRTKQSWRAWASLVCVCWLKWVKLDMHGSTLHPCGRRWQSPCTYKNGRFMPGCCADMLC